MKKGGRKGAIKKRSDRPIRSLDLGYYLIITDTKETEKNYFDGFLRKIPDYLQDRVRISVISNIKTENLIQKAVEMRATEIQPRKTWIVLDRDKVAAFDKIVNEAKEEGFECGWSNPCFEIFLLTYFEDMPSIDNSVTCCRHFSYVFEKKVGQEYKKKDKRIYEKLTQYGDEKKAISRSKERSQQHCRDGFTKPSKMIPGTTVYALIEELNAKISKSSEKK